MHDYNSIPNIYIRYIRYIKLSQIKPRRMEVREVCSVIEVIEYCSQNNLIVKMGSGLLLNASLKLKKNLKFT